MAEGDWWFDLKTHTVVPDNNDTKITDRLGPYKTREEAERALERVEERNEAYDNDPRWNDDLDRSIARREHPTQHGMLAVRGMHAMYKASVPRSVGY